MTRTSTRDRLLIAVLAFLAYLPALDAGFLGIDDPRFVSENEGIRTFAPVSFFTDPSTSATVGHDGTYRPLRTLDFAIDWAIGGGAPFLFHLRNVLYHVICSVLVFLLFVRIVGRNGGVAMTGALVFALHPVGVESVAWITSRADGLLLGLLLGALLMHVSGRRFAAAGLFVAALFAKEAAVVLPALVVLVDRLRREPPRWRWYAVYGSMAVVYAVLWRVLMGSGGHLDSEWWGGSREATLLTMARGTLQYAQLILFPVAQAFDYHVPAMTGFDLGAVLGILLVAGLIAAAVFGGRRVRFVLGWVAVTILPTANLLYTVGIPTAERFLYVPMVAVALGAGWLLHRTPLRWGILAALLALTFARAGDWRSTDALFEANGGISTPRSLDIRAQKAVFRVRAAATAGDRAGIEEGAGEIDAATDELFRLYDEDIGISPGIFGVRLLVNKAEALQHSGRYEDALAVARRSLRTLVDPHAHVIAGYACAALERTEEAAGHFEAAIRTGYADRDLRPVAVGVLNLLGRTHAAEGRPERSLAFYRRSWRLFPDPRRNQEAHEALGREGRPR